MNKTTSCPGCNGKGFVNPDGSPVNAFEGLDSDPHPRCCVCGGRGTMTASTAAVARVAAALLLYDELDHWLGHGLVALLEKHTQYSPCGAIEVANEECGPMAKYIRELVRQEIDR